MDGYCRVPSQSTAPHQHLCHSGAYPYFGSLLAQYPDRKQGAAECVFPPENLHPKQKTKKKSKKFSKKFFKIFFEKFFFWKIFLILKIHQELKRYKFVRESALIFIFSYLYFYFKILFLRIKEFFPSLMFTYSFGTIREQCRRRIAGFFHRFPNGVQFFRIDARVFADRGPTREYGLLVWRWPSRGLDRTARRIWRIVLPHRTTWFFLVHCWPVRI